MTVKHDFVFVCHHHLANMCYFLRGFGFRKVSHEWHDLTTCRKVIGNGGFL